MNKLCKRSVALVLILALLLSGIVTTTPPATAQPNTINISTWDPNFVTRLRAMSEHAPFDSLIVGNYLDLSVAAWIWELNLSEANIACLRGIEHFPSLNRLMVDSNQLTALDLSGNPKLSYLWASRNNLSTLNVSNNPALVQLHVSENNLSTLDVSNNSRLMTLSVSFNTLNALDVTNNPALWNILASDNNLSTLDLSNNPELDMLEIALNNLNALDLSNNPVLRALFAANNNLDALDLSNNPELEFLNAFYNNISTLNVSNNPVLEVLGVGGNNLSNLNVSNNPMLRNLSANQNNLEILDVSNNQALRLLDISNNNFSTLDVSNNPELSVLWVRNNSLSTLDVSHLDLWELVASYNLMVSRDSVIGWQNVTNFHFYPQRTDAFPFTDIAANHWARDYVATVFEHNIMQGVSATTFAPDQTLSRAMVATILHRMAGEPSAIGGDFGDVPSGQWFSTPIAWAHQTNIVHGYAGNFNPHGNVTREQFVAMLHRYAVYSGQCVAVPPEFVRPGYGQVSEWAEPYVRWASYRGLLQEAEGPMNPAGHATRAEAAAMLARFLDS
ncbi:MAG: S-layer homology domain-containing protein [Oscillospiraceae bacterium]|nr:S-layer homology domain-containing protein [Oscillospiraceae bacterium]